MLSLWLQIGLVPTALALVAPRGALAGDAPAAVVEEEGGAAEQQARAHYAEGEAAFNAGRYDQALVEFEAGFAASPRPGFLLNIGHAYRKLGELHKSRAAYKKFLLVDPTSTVRAEVAALITELDSALADEDHAERTAAAAVVTQPPVFSGAGAPRSPRPPGVDLAARSGAPSENSDSTLPGGDRKTAPFYRRAWFWGAVGAAVVGAGIGIYALQRGSGDGFQGSGSLGSLR